MFPLSLSWNGYENANLGSNTWRGFYVDGSPSNLNAALHGAKSQASANSIGGRVEGVEGGIDF